MYTYLPERRAREHGSFLTALRRSQRGRCVGGWGWRGLVLLVGLLCLPRMSQAGQLGPLYSRAHNAFKAQKWAQAARDFHRLLPLLQQRQASLDNQSKGFHLLTLGQCDVLYHLAEARWRQRKPRRSCLLHEQLRRRLKSLPAGWHKWAVHPDVPRRVTESQRFLKTQCARVPSRVQLSVSPQHTKVFVLAHGKWKLLTDRSFETLAPDVTLRLMAVGYQTREWRKQPIQRWQASRLTLTLEKRKPPPIVARRKIIRPRPLPLPRPAAAPVYKTWWFWTITGVVVVGGAATIAIVASQQVERAAVLKPAEGNSKGFPLF